MYATLKLIVMVVITAGLLAGCGNDGKYDGKTAKEWADVAREKEQPKQTVAAAPVVSAPQVSQEKTGPTEAEQAQKRQIATEAFLASVDEKVGAITSSKDGKIITEAAQLGLEQVDTGEISLNHMNGLFVEETLSKVIPEVRTEDPWVRIDYKAVAEGRSKVRQAIVKWFVTDPKRLDIVWTVVRPVLRQKYSLLNTLRGHEKLFKTPYTPKGFAPLYECLQWHETLIYGREETPRIPNPKDKAACNGLFKTFGVQGVEFGVKNEDKGMTRENIAFDNAMWVVEFLKRREADGGQVFAQKFQTLASDFVK